MNWIRLWAELVFVLLVMWGALGLARDVEELREQVGRLSLAAMEITELLRRRQEVVLAVQRDVALMTARGAGGEVVSREELEAWADEIQAKVDTFNVLLEAEELLRKGE